MERGKIVRWNDEKGFGFIKPETANGKDVFIHISILKQMVRKPVVGDQVNYFSELQSDGKSKAIKANIEGVAVIASTSKRDATTNHNKKSHNRHSRQSKSSSVMLIPLLVILVLGIFGFQRFEALTAQSNTQVEISNEPPLQQLAAEPIKWEQPNETFRCEAGKQHCSQMRSCAEAKYYQRNCPGTKMDGDSDGIPCERQWCN
ncbi:excalibur calcium-binding domain-containing protein [Shewanella sp. UCD-KL12]|uniref:excalibur calcium-binding domain-containing protein n=1 Tax=Shewanella sp. UCD-KL12 TaxID=1917163 RepID=UPI00097142E7|nr:excalibur calcium-binding domain-containing protein [Shewanella sp. UCD-KL12]